MKFLNRPKRYLNSLLIFVLPIALIANLTGCSVSVKADDLMSGISPNKVSGKATDDKFITNVSQFSIELFKKSISDKENSLISPLSVLIALSMTANGAAGETLSQMEKALGMDIPIKDLNEYLYTYVNNLPSEDNSKLNIANSIWFRDNKGSFTVNKDFLQKNSDYYNAAIYKSAFDSQTVKDINNWTKKSTDNMIDKVIDRIDGDTVMFLINAVAFDAKWENVYTKENILKDNFTSIDGKVQNIDFMCSSEPKYIGDDKASGFIKPYINDKYSFVALLPNENININDYIATLTGKSFQNTIKSAQDIFVSAYLPKFSYNYSIKLNDALKNLGIQKAFSPEQATLGKLGKSSEGNIFIGDVFHKTFISVDELGTKAGAVTKVEIKCESVGMVEKTIKLNRPFVYAIIDNTTNLPVFIGTVMSL
ncbi:serpin family protein [Acetivibrio cellulolyticus]|uniref:serpin family protein n=1 Tax=Acetivibrio cellulolyticus TaxID=35830 RepID=UPI0001E2C2D5|nr:serpin family protein [Acetivibrio cellulolyticus]